jgi:hypothetical protein
MIGSDLCSNAVAVEWKVGESHEHTRSYDISFV